MTLKYIKINVLIERQFNFSLRIRCISYFHVEYKLELIIYF